jgi:hypothetical protein
MLILDGNDYRIVGAECCTSAAATALMAVNCTAVYNFDGIKRTRFQTGATAGAIIGDLNGQPIDGLYDAVQILSRHMLIRGQDTTALAAETDTQQFTSIRRQVDEIVNPDFSDHGQKPQTNRPFHMGMSLFLCDLPTNAMW